MHHYFFSRIEGVRRSLERKQHVEVAKHGVELHQRRRHRRAAHGHQREPDAHRVQGHQPGQYSLIPPASLSEPVLCTSPPLNKCSRLPPTVSSIATSE